MLLCVATITCLQAAPLIRQLIEAGNNTLSVFCNIADLTQYVVSNNNSTDLRLLQNFVCSGMVDFTAVLDELTNINPQLTAMANVVSYSIIYNELLYFISIESSSSSM